MTASERTLVFSGGPVITMDPLRPGAGTVVVSGSRIARVGDRDLVDAFPHAEHHDLAGRTLVPGFVDAHCHLSAAALQPCWADLRGISTLDELAGALRRQRDRTPEGAWLRGDEWDEVTTGLSFDRHDLDAIAGERPTIVMHATYHQAVLNSAGLDLLGLGRQAAMDDPLIAVDEHGDPTGLLLERSAGKAHTASLTVYSDPDRWADHIERHATDLLCHGITAVHDAAVDPPAEAVYALLAAQGRLPVSVLMMPAGVPFLSNDLGARLEGPPTGNGDEQLRVGPMKVFADGGAMPAFDLHVGGHPLEMGYRHPDLGAAARAAVERGFHVGAHAIGNQGSGTRWKRSRRRRGHDRTTTIASASSTSAWGTGSSPPGRQNWARWRWCSPGSSSTWAATPVDSSRTTPRGSRSPR